MKKLLIALALLVLVGLGVAGYGLNRYQAMLEWLQTPYKTEAKPQTVVIAPGTTVRGALNQLIELGTVAPSDFVRYVGKIGPTVVDVKVGEYEVSASMAPLEQLERMRSGKVKTYSFTIPEGYTVSEIDADLAAKGFITAGDILGLQDNKVFLKQLEIPQLEGYLLPNTYHLTRPFDAKKIVRAMVGLLRREYEKELSAQAKARGRSLQQILVIASIVEKESGGAEEYPLVASVIENRLKRGMRLQMDPTVIYGIKHFDGNLTRRHLQTDHPWNTYTRNGLPPSPICNPGLGAIRAAVKPAETDYLFFVSMNNGHHIFTKTLAEHNRAVTKYQVHGHVGP